MKPTLFIGSSSESLDVAYAIQENLEDCSEPIVWKQGLFDVSEFVLESLLDALDDANFGVFVFAADDLTKIRGQEMKTTRDNIIFELGLFVGRLGRKRSFVVMPKEVEGLHLPSDLVGLNTATFAMPEDMRRLVAAPGPTCNKIRRAIKDAVTGSVPAPSEGNNLALIFSLAVPEPQQKHLANLAEGKTKSYQGRGSLRSELRHLVSVGLLEKLPGRHIGDMTSGGTYDLAEFVRLTDSGRQWVDRIKQSRSRPQTTPSS
ncbi:MAG TPA: nucleotide-binding protein [Terriglobia bacterium]|nr:nucleotide-binding protein [Terriglobia bacterium]